MINCRACTGPVVPLLDLGLQPVCNRFLASPHEPEYRHSFKAGVCQLCGIMQLIDPFPAEELQPKVDWITYHEPEGHLDSLASQLASRLPDQAFILGMSFKDDSTLERLQRKGFRTKRLEPAADLDISHRGAGVESVQKQFTVARARMLSQKYGKADALIIRHILEHVYDLPGFLQAIKELLKPEGQVVFEVPDCSRQLELLDYSTLWEEHLVYFTPETYRNCLIRQGFTIESWHIIPAVMEDSLIAVVRSSAGPVPSVPFPVGEEIRRVEQFANSFLAHRNLLQAYFRKHKIAVFGAGHFSCLLINALQLPVLYTIDDDPHKKGLFLPGSRLPIYGSEVLQDRGPGNGDGNAVPSGVPTPEVCVLAINPAAEKKIVSRFTATTFRSFCPASPYSVFTEATSFREHSPEVYYGVGKTISLDKEALHFAKEKSGSNARQRSRLCTHQSITDSLHEMMIVHKKDTYVRPHLHLGKPESLHVLEGSARVILFDEEGRILQTISLGEYASGKKFYYKLNTALYHTLLITSDIFVFHESTTGPFRKEDTVFAPWSPEETNLAEVKRFLDHLRKEVGEKEEVSLPQPHTLVIGGTKGIGRSIAKLLTARGDRVSVLGRTTPAAITGIDDWRADLARPADCLSVIDQLVARQGPITQVVFSQRYRGEEDWDKELAVSVTATAKIIDHLKNNNYFDQSRQKAIVVLSSIAGTSIVEEQKAPYHAAKAALNQLVKYYATILGPQGIRVNSISPGTTVKEESREFYSRQEGLSRLYRSITPLQRMGTADDVANLAAFLCSDQASFITGQNIVIDGGASLPGQESLARRLMLTGDGKTLSGNKSADPTVNQPVNQQVNQPVDQPVNKDERRPVRRCRLCPNDGMEFIMRLASTPIGDAYFYEKKELPCYPLDLYLCEKCGLLQIPHLIDPQLIYRDYIYHTADSMGLVDHFRKYVESVLKRVNPPANALVVEIGSNDGSVLQCFKDAGMRILGVDPAREIAERATRNGLTTLPEFFTATLAQKIVAERGKASIIIANNVLANIDDLTEVMGGIKTLLAGEGVLVFETGYALDLFQKKIFDNVYHEHLSYFSVKPLQTFFHQQGLQLIHVERVPTKGGSIRCTVQWATGTKGEEPSVTELLALEEVTGIHSTAVAQRFAGEIEELKAQLTTLLQGLKGQGKKIAGYGAAVGCTTVLYALGLHRYIDFLVDDNAHRQNRYVPGLPILVRSPQEIYRTDYVVILAWQYAEPIIKKHQHYFAQGGKFINFLPQLTIIDKSVGLVF